MNLAVGTKSMARLTTKCSFVAYVLEWMFTEWYLERTESQVIGMELREEGTFTTEGNDKDKQGLIRMQIKKRVMYFC